jgi:NitT/TauT family transport system substrate-binding protein
MNMSFALSTLVRVDAGEPIVLLAGVHVGCYELFGTPAIHTVRDLKGRRIAVPGAGSTPPALPQQHPVLRRNRSTPRRELGHRPSPKGRQLLADGDVDAYMAFPPEAQEMRQGRHWACRYEQRDRQTVVSVLLLYSCRQSATS